MAWNRNKKKGKKKMEQVFYIYKCVNLNQTYAFICCVRLPNQE